MSCKKKCSHEAAAPSTSSLKEQRAQALEAAAAYLTAAQDKAAPLAAQVSEKLGPLSEQFGGPVSEKLGPLADQAVDAGKKALDASKDYAQDKVVPALQQAYDTFQKDVLPGLEERAEKVASLPAVEEASRRGQAAISALRGQTLDLADKAGVETKSMKKAKRRGTLKKVLGTISIIGGVAAAAVVVSRRFLGSADDGWTAHEPKVTYSWTPKGEEAEKKPTSAPAPEPERKTEAPAEAPARADSSTSDETPVATMADEGGPAAAQAETTAETKDVIDEGARSATTTKNGEPKSYIGDNPPEGFVIKGNDRSMKYHVPGSGGYDRTIADVWFSTEEDAQAAGFTKAQR